MYLTYSFLLAFVAVLSSPYWLVRGLKEKKYLQNVRQRLGWRVPLLSLPERPLWLHAVSVGEVLAAKALFLGLRAAQPDLPIVVSTVTMTGQALARKEMPAAAAVFYFPFDWSFCVRRFLTQLKPRALVLLETELWPNFLRICGQRRIPVLLANGRISNKSVGRYRLIRGLTRSMLGNVTLLGVQTAEDKRRFLELGAKEPQVYITGNLKFDFPVPQIDSKSDLLELIRSALRLGSDSPVVVVGSTMKGEEPLMLDAFAKVRTQLPEARMILAPRHPERFAEVADMLARSGLPFQRRSEVQQGLEDRTEILLLDSIGELRQVYSLASVAVIGGSFLPRHGGHNPLEAAVFGKAIIFGPHMSNFKEIAGLLIQEHAARRCPAQALPATLLELLRDPRTRQELGQRAMAAMSHNQGATEITIRLILSHTGRAI